MVLWGKNIWKKKNRLSGQNEIVMNRPVLSAIKSCLREEKKEWFFFLSVVNGSIRTTVSVHTEFINTFLFMNLYEILQPSESGNFRD